MRLRGVFNVQIAVFFWKIPLNSCLMGLDQLFKGRAGGSAKGKCFNNIISTISTVCPMWTDGNDVGRQGKGPDFESGHNLFLFASFLFYFFFSLSVLFSFCFVKPIAIYKFQSDLYTLFFCHGKSFFKMFMTLNSLLNHSIIIIFLFFYLGFVYHYS